MLGPPGLHPNARDALGAPVKARGSMLNMSAWVRGAVWAAAILLGAAVPASAAVPPPRGIGIEEPLDGPAVLADAWPAQRSGPRVALVVHLVIAIRTFQGAGSAAALARLDDRLETYASRGIPVVLVLGAMPSAKTRPNQTASAGGTGPRATSASASMDRIATDSCFSTNA